MKRRDFTLAKRWRCNNRNLAANVRHIKRSRARRARRALRLAIHRYCEDLWFPQDHETGAWEIS